MESQPLFISERPLLKALSIPELLDKVLQLYRRHTFLLMGLFAIVLLPLTLIRSALVLGEMDPRWVDLLLFRALQPLSILAVVAATTRLYLGESPSIFAAFGEGSAKYWGYVGVSFLMGLALLPVGFVYWVFSLGGTLTTLFGGLIALTVAIYLFTRWGMVLPAMIFENLGASDSLERSWRLTDGYFWRVLGTNFAARLLAVLFSIFPALLLTYALQLLGAAPGIIVIVTSVVEQLVVIVTAPLTYGVMVLIYFDLRIRKEGFDLQFAAEDSE